MSICAKFTGKLAVAALAVAGVVGMVSAQSTVAGATNGATENTAPLMKASFNVNNFAVIEGITNDPADDALNFSVEDSVGGTTTPGNLGVIRVKTNASAWDVTMSTKNGGRLMKDGRGTGRDTTICDVPNTWPLTGCQSSHVEEILEPGYKLLFNDHIATTPGRIGAAGRDTVVLRVAIGPASAVNSDTGRGGTFGIIVAKGAQAAGDLYEPTIIDQDDLLISNDPATPISFAKAFADFYNGYTGSNTTKGDGSHTTVGGVIMESASALSTDGFGPTTGDPSNKWEYFYINVGIDPTEFVKIVGPKSGEYYEIFSFDLVTNLE